jgi:hypothetical protein
MAGGAWGLVPTVFAFERSFNHASPAAFPAASPRSFAMTRPHHPTADPIDHEADLQRIDEALATLETVTQAWFEHQRLKACQPGLLLSLNRLLDLTSLAKGYASALRVIAEP